MKLIEILSDKITEEISDAKSYAEMALENREAYPELADTLYDLSREEMGHMSRLHTAVAGIIEKYRKEKSEPPADMMAIYNYLHKKQIERAAEVKTLQETYKDI